MIDFDLTKPGVKLALGLGVTLVLVLLYLAVFYGGYRHGYTTAKDKGDKALAELRQAQADAWAESKAKALDRYVLATQRADQLATEHHAAQQRLADTRNEIIKEIPHATAGLAACAFGPDFLRTYNRALGLGGPGVPEAAGTGEPAADNATARTADAGVRGGPPITASPADLLTHAADYGKWCWDTADQRDKLLKLLTEEGR